GARTIGPLWPWATQAALAAEVRSPSLSSTTLVTVTGSVPAGLGLVIERQWVAGGACARGGGPVCSTARVGVSLGTGTVAGAVAGLCSASWPRTVPVSTTVPAFTAAAVVKLKRNVWPWASTIGTLWPWATHAALAAAVRSPSLSSTTLVTVTGSVSAGLVLV